MRNKPVIGWAMAAVCILNAEAGWAAPLPSVADPGRIDRKPETAPMEMPKAVTVPKIRVENNNEAPAGSNKVSFMLHSVTFDGMHAFSEQEVADIYAPYLNQKITLDKVWAMAGQLTERYQAEGYFLSRAYVPAQEIEGGDIHLKVVEGYIGDIRLDDTLKDSSAVRALCDRLSAEKPLKARSLESSLLRLNDLPGVSVRAVLSLPDTKNAPEGETVLTLVHSESAGAGKVSFDNHGSKFLGPYQVSAQYQNSFIPMQKTSASVLGATQLDELKYGNIRHEVSLFPNATMEAYASYTKADPGSTLAVQDIRSKSLNVGVDFNYQWIRQRDENLKTTLALDSRDTRGTIFGVPLTRDAVRALRIGASFDATDRWNGFNQANTTLSQGIEGLGSSDAGDAFISRAGAKPDFRKLELAVSRLQNLSGGFQGYLAASGQIASGSLYSSEQFGYGGQAFGRAYDASEITGDEGIAASIELRYNGLDKIGMVTPAPYVFYDIGTVWNDNTAVAPARVSGSSAGFGVRAATDLGITTDLGLAFPLTRPAMAPLYSNNGKNPRLMFEASYGF